MKHLGQPVAHESASDHVSGRAAYTDDLINRFPNILHAWPVLSPHAHAKICRLDVSGASSVAGVVTTLTAADVPGVGNTGVTRQDEPLFPDEVLFHSQPVAWVLADTLEAARLGAERVTATYEPLPAILELQDAIAQQSTLAGPAILKRGDAHSAIAGSPLTFEGELFIGGQEHFYLETNCAIAWLDESGGIALHSSTQHPSEVQAIVARVLSFPEHRVTVECLRMGGAFGGKEVQANAWASIAALGALKTGRPVRVRLPRLLDMVLTGKRHPFLARFAVGYDVDGRLLGLDLHLYSDGGWSLDLSEPVLWRAMFHVDNTYLLSDVHVTGYVCRTNKTSQTAFRGFGGPQGMVVIEEILDRIARSLSLAPELVRERNFYREGDTTHYGMPVKDASRITRIWNQLKTSAALSQRRESISVFNSANENRKRGIAITPVKFGISFTATFYNQAGALVLVYRDGTVQVNHGGTEMGQGLHTKIRQIAAESLGVSPAAIRVMPTRTDKVPNTSATAASASTDLNGAAVADACAQLLSRLRPIAAKLLKCDPADIFFGDGAVYAAREPDRTIEFATVVEAAYRDRIPLFAQGFYRTPGIHFDPETGRGEPFRYFAYGAAVSEVEVDRFTGEHRLLRTDILQDVGDSAAPLIDLGQIEGGFMQGLGWLTLEELVWSQDGHLLTNGASTYKLPALSELPENLNVDFLTRATESGVIYGSKAVGEPPLMLAISVREAIRDAIAAFGAGGPVFIDSPATPERIYWAIERARGSKLAPQPGSVEAVPV